MKAREDWRWREDRKNFAQGGTALENHTHAYAATAAVADATTHQRVVESNAQMKNEKKETKRNRQQQHWNTWILQAWIPNVNKHQIFGVYFFSSSFSFSLFENAALVCEFSF